MRTALLEASEPMSITEPAGVGCVWPFTDPSGVKELRLCSAGLTLGLFSCAQATRVSGTLEVQSIASLGGAIACRSDTFGLRVERASCVANGSGRGGESKAEAVVAGFRITSRSSGRSARHAPCLRKARAARPAAERVR